MPTMLLRSVLRFVPAGLACAALGYLAGRHESFEPRSAGSSSSPTIAAAAPATLRTPVDSDMIPEVTDAEAWDGLRSAPATPSSEERQRAYLRELAKKDPARAIKLAESAATPRRRDEFVRAVLGGWAAVDPLAAARWAIDKVRLGERRVAVEALLEGAIADPAAAIETGKFLCVTDSVLQSDHGNALVSAFARAGRFELAARFAATAPGDFRAHWLSTAFLSWAQYQPDAAVAAAHAFDDPVVRDEALQGVINGWGASDPAALVASAERFPVGTIRDGALREGLQQWVFLDPVAASAWMDRRDPSRELDSGAAALATTPALVSRRPEVAASWAESITDPSLRADTLLDFVRLWAETDPSSARNYAATSPALRPETRELALSSLSPSP
jgi:hypothetical protein